MAKDMSITMIRLVIMLYTKPTAKIIMKVKLELQNKYLENRWVKANVDLNVSAYSGQPMLGIA